VEAPEWWYWITAIFALVGTIALFAMAGAVLMLIKKMQEMQPRIDAISTRVDRIAERVENISETIEGIAGSAKGTVESIATGASSLIRSLTSIGGKVEAGMSKFAPVLVGIKLAQTAYAAFTDRKKAKSPDNGRPLPAKIEVER
jgi:hypothetical protein